MRSWDLTTGATKLYEATKALQAAQSAVASQWDDKTSHDFQEEYLAPLEPRVRRTLEAVRRLAEVLEKARRECETY